jgi:hypothetical protein
MTKTYTITREALKKQNFSSAVITKQGAKKEIRDVSLIAKILKELKF